MKKDKQIYFDVENTSNEVKEFHLLGYSKYLHSLNFGNDTNLRIKPFYGSYLQVLVESAFSPCKTKFIRLMSLNKKNIEQVGQFISEDGFGCVETTPILFKIPTDQHQQDITQLYIGKRVDYNTTLKFKIEPNSKMTVMILAEELERVDYIQSHNPTLSQIAKLFFKKLFKLK